MAVMGRFDNLTDGYKEIEDGAKVLRRRHAEKLVAWYAALRELYMKERGYRPPSNGRRPFVTHFTGCQPCNGEHNPSYEGDTCWTEMVRALNFADNQVLRNYGFVHKDPGSSTVDPVPFDYPWNDLW
ncbi:hypothetical protein L6164_019805 [Bauhinia variegata]|nr:hypothetical protein L6164_019805 [Bauhinia variegata]